MIDWPIGFEIVAKEHMRFRQKKPGGREELKRKEDREEENH